MSSDFSLKTDFKSQIDGIIMELAFCDTSPEPEDSLSEQLGIDSLRLVELIVMIEEKLQIEIDESELEPEYINTVSDLYRIVEKYV